MPVLRKDGPYIWTTWLSKLLVGDNSCEWAAWFKTQFDSQSWTKAEQIGNLARWQIGHTDMLNRKARELREQGYEVTREAQNQFTVNAKTLRVAVAGKVRPHRPPGKPALGHRREGRATQCKSPGTIVQ